MEATRSKSPFLAAASGEGQSTMTIIDNTEQNLVAFRRNVYLTIQSSLDYQEAAHKLLKMELKPGMEVHRYIFFQ